MNHANKEDILKILDKERFANIATTNGEFVDNAVVCYANNQFALYFGCYDDTLKARNIAVNAYVAITIGSLQIHGLARKIPYKNREFDEKMVFYKKKWSQYVHVFDKENNELYGVKPLVIWLYNPTKGEMNRDVLIWDQAYYTKLAPYEAKREYKQKVLSI